MESKIIQALQELPPDVKDRLAAMAASKGLSFKRDILPVFDRILNALSDLFEENRRFLG